MRDAGLIAEKVLARARRGRRILTDRSLPARCARGIARAHRKKWRENGCRPRGRGFDFARQLIPEELLKACDARGIVEISALELARKVKCSDRIVRFYIARLAMRDQYGKPASGPSACLVKLPRDPGPRSPMRLQLNAAAMGEVLKWLRRPKKSIFARRSPQIPLFEEKPMQVPAEIQEIIDRLQAKARAAATTRMSGEVKANRDASPGPRVSSIRPDLFPHTPISQKEHQVTPHARSIEGPLRGQELKGSKARGNRIGPPDRAWFRQDSLEIEEIWKQSGESFPVLMRRRLMRQLRYACWARGLDHARTRKVCGAIGWESQRLRKATSRRYLVIDAIRWVLRATPAQLAKATNHWLNMQSIVKTVLGTQE